MKASQFANLKDEESYYFPGLVCSVTFLVSRTFVDTIWLAAYFWP